MKLNRINGRERNICLLLFLPAAIMGFFNFPAKYAIVSLLFVGTYAMYFSDRRFREIAFSFPMKVWLLLTVYHCINAYAKNVPGVDAIDFLHGMKIYACIVIIAYWARIDFKKTVNILILVYCIRCAVVLFLLLGFGATADNGRLTGAGGSATGLGQMAAMTATFLVYLNVFKRVPILKNIAILALPLTVVALSQTRNALAMTMISVLAISILYVQTNNKVSFSKLIIGLVLFTIVAFVALKALSGTAFEQRFHSSYEESYFFRNNATGTIFDKIVGDRLVYYVMGWSFFLQSPVTGIGMWNFKPMHGGDYPLHSEYMIHLCEGGLIGIGLWLLFLFCIFRIIFKYSLNIWYKVAALSSMAVLLFCAIYAREFFYETFYPVYGLILSFLFISKDEHKKRQLLYKYNLRNNEKNI